MEWSRGLPTLPPCPTQRRSRPCLQRIDPSARESVLRSVRSEQGCMIQDDEGGGMQVIGSRQLNEFSRFVHSQEPVKIALSQLYSYVQRLVQLPGVQRRAPLSACMSLLGGSRGVLEACTRCVTRHGHKRAVASISKAVIADGLERSFIFSSSGPSSSKVALTSGHGRLGSSNDPWCKSAILRDLHL